MKKIFFFALLLSFVSACTTHPELQKASLNAKSGQCQTDQLGALLSLNDKKVGGNPPKNVRFTGPGAEKIKGRQKQVPEKNRITLGVDRKGEIVSAYCG